jgi:hypothetical protein
MIRRSGCVLWSDPTHGGAAVTFNEVLSQTIAMLHQHGRVSYRALKRQFALDDAFLEDLKYELIEVQQLARDHRTPPVVSPNLYSRIGLVVGTEVVERV